ncbi:hypothetical protein [Bradyrhizobium phage BDU-MI-1]|nr:hypothetical protein [Bradyrhizobium phage BDU-MI-1]
MALHRKLAKYLDGLDASVDGRGFDGKHEKARIFVEGACKLVSQLARMDTPTDGVDDEDKADDIMADLDDERLCSDATALYEMIREARRLQAGKPE